MLKFVSSSTAENGDAEACYNAVLAPDKTDKEGASFPVKLVISEKGATAAVELGTAQASDEEGAFDNLASALERCAKAIRARGEVTRGVPIYS